MTVTVVPESFTFVEFDADEIRDTAERVLGWAGLADAALTVDVNEKSPLGGIALTSVEPIVIEVESGALEDPKKPRHMSSIGTELALGVKVLQARDRLDAAFAAPGVDDDVATRYQTAWDIYSVARLAGFGHEAHRARWQYHFRNRHGFTDAADAEFERLWAAPDLTWADLTRLSDTAAAAKLEAEAAD